jgi:hypothetical protein
MPEKPLTFVAHNIEQQTHPCSFDEARAIVDEFRNIMRSQCCTPTVPVDRKQLGIACRIIESWIARMETPASISIVEVDKKSCGY